MTDRSKLGGARRGALATVFAASLLLSSGVERPAAAAPAVATVGQPAPPFLLEDLAGTPVASKSLRGKPVYINLFASWCPPCRTELPAIVRSYGHFKGQIAYLGVDEQEPAERITPFVRTMGIGYPVAIDQGQLQASLGARAIPLSVFIDRRGIVRAIFRGPIPADVLHTDLQRIASR
jgi:thiol-disulfide isomerase/thioredoxin